MNDPEEDSFEQQWKPYLTEQQLRYLRSPQNALSLFRLSLPRFGFLIVERNWEVTEFSGVYSSNHVYYSNRLFSVHLDLTGDGYEWEIPHIEFARGGLDGQHWRLWGGFDLQGKWLPIAESTLPNAIEAREFEAEYKARVLQLRELELYQERLAPDYRPPKFMEHLDMFPKEVRDKILKSQNFIPEDPRPEVVKLKLEKLNQFVSENYGPVVDARLAVYATAVRLCLAKLDQRPSKLQLL
jgi:hypothetical protein